MSKLFRNGWCNFVHERNQPRFCTGCQISFKSILAFSRYNTHTNTNQNNVHHLRNRILLTLIQIIVHFKPIKLLFIVCYIRLYSFSSSVVTEALLNTSMNQCSGFSERNNGMRMGEWGRRLSPVCLHESQFAQSF